MDYVTQKENQIWLKEVIGSEMMVPVFGKILDSNYDIYIQSIIVPIADIDKHMEKDTYDFGECIPGVTIFGGNEEKYLSWGNDDGLEPLVLSRNFEGLQEDYLEIVQEFILLFNLSNTDDRDIYIDLNNREERVVKIDNGTVYFNKRYLKTYLTLKEKALLIHIDSRCINLTDENIDDVDYTYRSDDNHVFYTVKAGYCNDFAGKIPYSLLFGKKIVMGCDKSKCNVWPYNQEHEYINFAIGLDEDGKAIEYSCDPAGLRNYFGANLHAPHYLCPIYFDKAVLDKYRKRSDIYFIEDGMLRCGTKWGLPIDNHHKDYLLVYLGDLGRDLPDVEEQRYWRGFNRPIEKKISRVKYERDFEAQFAEATDQPFVFINTYNKLNNRWHRQFGWSLFRELKNGDEYNFTSLHIPDGKSQSEFDILVLSLNKIICDSLNEHEISKSITSKDSIKGSISKLECWLRESGKIGFEDHITTLRNLQELRSSGTGHRKGDNYKKICKKLSIVQGKLDDAFIALLDQMTGVLNYLEKEFIVNANTP